MDYLNWIMEKNLLNIKKIKTVLKHRGKYRGKLLRPLLSSPDKGREEFQHEFMSVRNSGGVSPVREKTLKHLTAAPTETGSHKNFKILNKTLNQVQGDRGKCNSLAQRERVSEGQERGQSGLLRRFAPRNDGYRHLEPAGRKISMSSKSCKVLRFFGLRPQNDNPPRNDGRLNNRNELINLSTYLPIHFKKIAFTLTEGPRRTGHNATIFGKTPRLLRSAGFTLTEVLLACVIVGVISALVLPVFVSKYRQKSFDLGFERMTKTLNNALDNLIVTENKGSYFSTMMYVSEEPESYLDNSGQFIKKYLKLSKYCGDSNRDCFANVYYKYENKNKSVYNPEFKGACGSLKNGSSICLTPQISANSPQVLIDINGKKGPNVLGQDLRTFTLNSKTKTILSKATQDVITEPYERSNSEPEEPDTQGPCDINPKSLECCQEQGVNDDNKSWCCELGNLNRTSSFCHISWGISSNKNGKYLANGSRSGGYFSFVVTGDTINQYSVKVYINYSPSLTNDGKACSPNTSEKWVDISYYSASDLHKLYNRLPDSECLNNILKCEVKDRITGIEYSPTPSYGTCTGTIK